MMHKDCIIETSAQSGHKCPCCRRSVSKSVSCRDAFLHVREFVQNVSKQTRLCEIELRKKTNDTIVL
jgi:hypothetical protein